MFAFLEVRGKICTRLVCQQYITDPAPRYTYPAPASLFNASFCSVGAAVAAGEQKKISKNINQNVWTLAGLQNPVSIRHFAHIDAQHGTALRPERQTWPLLFAGSELHTFLLLFIPRFSRHLVDLCTRGASWIRVSRILRRRPGLGRTRRPDPARSLQSAEMKRNQTEISKPLLRTRKHHATESKI